VKTQNKNEITLLKKKQRDPAALSTSIEQTHSIRKMVDTTVRNKAKRKVTQHFTLHLPQLLVSIHTLTNSLPNYTNKLSNLNLSAYKKRSRVAVLSVVASTSSIIDSKKKRKRKKYS